MRKLASPANPRSELDLAIYALPFLPRDRAHEALRRCRQQLEARADFLRERLEWCTTRALRMPALAFERPLVALEAELMWLDRLLSDYGTGIETRAEDWEGYVYLEPPVA